jgi:hypothetical protein
MGKIDFDNIGHDTGFILNARTRTTWGASETKNPSEAGLGRGGHARNRQTYLAFSSRADAAPPNGTVGAGITDAQRLIGILWLARTIRRPHARECTGLLRPAFFKVNTV